MQIELSPEVESMAKMAASSHGYDSVAAFIEEAVKEKATTAPNSADAASTDSDEWVAKLNAIGSRHKSTGYPVDDSRESIYPDR